MSCREPALIKLKLSPFVGNRPQPVQQADGLGVEVHENKLAEGLAADPRKTSATEIQIPKILWVSDRFQLTIK